MADLLRDLQEREVIAEGEGQWQLTELVEEMRLELPDSVMAMIERKIDRLDQEDLRLMRAASVQGFEFDSATLTRVSGMEEEEEEEEVEERLQVLENNHRFVQFTEEDKLPDSSFTLRYRFVHVLYQNQLYDSLTRTKRARLSRSTAQTLESSYGESTSEVAAELASLRESSTAVRYYGQAAEHAPGMFAYREAITLAQHGLELLNTLPESQERDQRELELQMKIGSSQTAVYGYSSKDVRDTYLRIRELIDRGQAKREVILSTFGLHSFYLSTLDMQGALDLSYGYLDLGERDEDETLLFLDTHYWRLLSTL